MVSKIKKEGLIPKTVIDVGANVGQFAVAAWKIFDNPILYSFEPDPDIFQKLSVNLKQNMNSKRFQIALGSEICNVEFHVNNYSLASSVLPLGQGHKSAFPSIKEERIIKVPMSTLDSIFRENPIIPPCLLKIDVQGYEDNVILGGKDIMHNVDFVIMETSFSSLYGGDKQFPYMLNLMSEQGFSFSHPIDFSISDTTGQIIQMDCLFIKN